MSAINRRTFFKATGMAAATTLFSPSAWLRAKSSDPMAGNSAQAGQSPAKQKALDAAKKKTVDAAIWKSYFDVRRVWGFADQHSIEPGESFNIMLSTGPGFDKIVGRLEVSRIGYYGDHDRKLVWKSSILTIERQEIQITSASLGVDWVPVINDMKTDGWESGYYTIDFVITDDDRDDSVAYIVVTNPSRSGDILLGLCTNTYNAYNAWGGYSLYESAFAGERAQMLSFDRPATPSFFDYDYYLVLWLERIATEHKFTIDYATNFDIYKNPSLVERGHLFISGCHNEYWSKEEFDAVHKRVFELGKSTIFIGANSAYWQVRYGDLNRSGKADNMGRQLICYKSPDDPIRQRVDDKTGDLLVTTRYRDGSRLPETMLAGIAYQNYFDPGGDNLIKYPYQVSNISLPFFHGTGWKVGDKIGDVVGYEWYNRDPDGDGKRLWDPTLSRIPAIELNDIKVLFTGHPVDVDGHPGVAEAVYFKSPAGGQVFSSGSIRWAWGLGKPSFESDAFRTFNRNLILNFLGKA
jgi:hypothetical protein